MQQRRAGITASLLYWSIAVALAGLLFGFDTAVISGADQPIQALWGTSDLFHGAFIMSSALWGTVIGALFGNIPCDKFGRKLTLIATGALFLVSALGSAIAPDPYTFSMLRFVGGLWRSSSAIFIDVLPRPPKPKQLPANVVWRDQPRHAIPGSVWLPNVGFGALNPEVEAYFGDNLERLTKGDQKALMVIYCLAQCWMSWNAAKRALSYGYTQVYWYPDGTDAWRAAGGELQELTPVPMEP